MERNDQKEVSIIGEIEISITRRKEQKTDTEYYRATTNQPKILEIP
jgi:regulatory protein YycI of two-component signal transduction system YycFG